MKKFYNHFLFLFFTISILFLYSPSYAGDHEPGQLIVLLKPGSDINVLTRKHSNLTNSPTELHILRELSVPMNIWLLSFNSSVDENALLNSIREDEAVAAAQFNFFFEERNTPDDALFHSQWNMNNTLQSGGIAGADIDALAAWNITTGGKTVQGDTIVIAVIDCGFDLTHADLNFWKNYKEIPHNGIDDDGNGYIDDYNGWNGVGNDTIHVCLHGTHVAGIAGAKGNNSFGITGVNWNVKLMPIDYISSNDANVIACYSYAFHMRMLYNSSYGAQGAFIVSTNSSFGKNNAFPVDHPVWCAMYDSLGSAGILSAGAGPNSNVNVDVTGDIPTTCPSDWLLSVTNTTSADNINGGSGWGPLNMDLGAPGTVIWSTIPGNLYGSQTGTSMSAPHVSGAVALMWAAACDEMISDYKKNPAVLASVMKNIMLDNVDTLPTLKNKTVSNGRLNLNKSLLGVQDYCKKYAPPKAFSYLIYPNPASGFTHIDFPSSVKPVLLQVSDFIGKNISVHSHEKVNEREGYKTLELDLTELSSGIYIVRLENGDDSYSFSHKLIVVK